MRLRRTFPLTLPGRAMLLAAGVLLALAACSQQPSADKAEAESAASADMAAAPEPQRAQAPAAPPAAVAEGAAAPTTAEPVPPPDPQTQLQSAAVAQHDGERKFIRTATAQFRVRDVYRSALAIEDVVAQHGGYVARNNIGTQIQDVRERPTGDGRVIELATYTVRGDLQVRVPSAKAQAFLRAIAAQVEFLDERNFAATDAQFDLLRQQLAYARQHDAASTLDEVAHEQGRLRDRTGAVEARTQAQAERDEALIQRRQFEDRIALATIDLGLYQMPQVRRTERVDVDAVLMRDGPSFFSRAWHSISGGWYGLLDVLVALMGAWPLWLALGVAAWFVLRLRRRKPAA